jgi:hypothetical protein
MMTIENPEKKHEEMGNMRKTNPIINQEAEMNY